MIGHLLHFPQIPSFEVIYSNITIRNFLDPIIEDKKLILNFPEDKKLTFFELNEFFMMFEPVMAKMDIKMIVNGENNR
jgi:hypothetical protein